MSPKMKSWAYRKKGKECEQYHKRLIDLDAIAKYGNRESQNAKTPNEHKPLRYGREIIQEHEEGCGRGHF
jgi:hypothetical protein